MMELYSVRDLRSFDKDEIINKDFLTASDFTQLIEPSKTTRIWWLPIKDSKTELNYKYLMLLHLEGVLQYIVMMATLYFLCMIISSIYIGMLIN